MKKVGVIEIKRWGVKNR